MTALNLPAVTSGYVRLITCHTREAWLRERAKSIGSSDAAAICGASPWRTKLDVYVGLVQARDAEDAGIPVEVDERMTERMRWGLRLETSIAEAFSEERQQLAVVEPPHHSLYRPAGIDFIHATPDRFVAPASVLEIKTTDSRNRDEWDGGVPLHYQIQVQHQLMVLKLDHAFVAVLIGGNELRTFEVEANRDFQDNLLAEIGRFMGLVEQRTPPPATSASDEQAVRRMFRNAQDGKAIALPSECVSVYEALAAAKAAKKAAEDEEKRLAAVLMQQMGDAELATLPDGRRVKWANETRNMPAQPARTIETRVMRLLKNKEV